MKALGVARVLLGAVFIYAAYDKILHPAHFAEAVANYRLLPAAVVNPAAHIVPVVELLCGLLLILDAGVAGASLLLTGLLVVFTTAIGQAIWRGLDIECGCFSAAAERVGYPVLLRDLVLLAVALIVFTHSLRAVRQRLHRRILL